MTPYPPDPVNTASSGSASGEWRRESFAAALAETQTEYRKALDRLADQPSVAGTSGVLSEAERDQLCICAEIASELGFRLTDDQIARLCGDTLTVVERILAARDAATEARVRAEVAAAIRTFGDESGEPHNDGCVGEPNCVACVWMDAARIARGERA